MGGGFAPKHKNRESSQPIDILSHIRELSKIRKGMIESGYASNEIDVGTLTQINFKRKQAE